MSIETEPLHDGAPGTCDWGYCDRESVAMRRHRSDALAEWIGEWLPVCSWHAGWDDHHQETVRHRLRIEARRSAPGHWDWRCNCPEKHLCTHHESWRQALDCAELHLDALAHLASEHGGAT